MKKFLLFILFLLPLYCLAQTTTNFTPQFKRKIPIDSLLGYVIPGLPGVTFWLPDTAWVKKHGGSASKKLYFSPKFKLITPGDTVIDLNIDTAYSSGTAYWTLLDSAHKTFRKIKYFTPENVANKATTFGTLNNTLYPTTQAVADYAYPLSGNPSGFITASSTSTLTNKSGNISQWTNDSGYLIGITSSQVTTALGYTPVTNARTVNGKALSSNIILGLASSDFANQGITTTVLHGNASGNPSFAQIGITDLSATGTPSSVTYLRGDNTWATIAAGGSSLTPTAVKTANYTASASDFVPVNTTSGSITITLPTAPADKSIVGVKQVIQGGSNTVTIAAGGSDVFNKTSGSTTLTLTLVNQGVQLQYASSSGIWYVFSDDLPLSGLDARYVPKNLTANKVLITDASGIGSIDSLDWVSSTKTLNNGTLSLNHSVDSIAFVGNSLTVGLTLPNKPIQRFSKLTADGLGYKEYNLGISGSTLVTYGTSNIPVKTTHRKILFLEFGWNDQVALVGDTATFHTNYNTFVASAISKGWVGSQMVFISINGSGYSAASTVNQIKFNTVISQVAAANGGKFIDVYSYALTTVSYGGQSMITVDNIHPNIRGSWITSKIILAAMNAPNWNFSSTNPSAAFQSLEIQKINIKNPLVLTNKPLILVADSTGNIGQTYQLPDSLTTGTHFMLTGSMVQVGAVLPSDYSATTDIVLTGGNAIKSTTASVAKGGAIVPFNSSTGITEYRNYWNAGSHDFYVSKGTNLAQNLAFTVQTNGIAKGIYGIETAINTAFISQFSTPGNIGMLTLFDNNGNTFFENKYSLGNWGIKLSNGSQNSDTYMFYMEPHGRVKIGTGVSTADIASSQFSIISTTTGSLPAPSMTTTQKLALGQVTPWFGANFSGSSGTGYTSNPSVVVSGGGGTGATATCVQVAGVVTSVTITAAGTGYISPISLVFSGGGGTGGTITGNAATVTTAEGMQVYDNTLHKLFYINGSSWVTSPSNASVGTSSQYVAGDGSYSTIGSKPHVIFTPTTGGTVTLTNNQYNIINPAGALLALTITLPSSPANNDCVFIKFTQNVTTVTYSGGTVVDGITAPTAGGLTVLTYDSGTTSWY